MKKSAAFLCACALALALIHCDGGQGGICYYDVDASIYPQGARESARVFYPCGVESAETVAATTLTSGRGGNKEGVYWLAERIAENGIVVCTVSALDNQSMEGYAVAQRAGLGILRYADQASESPIAGKIRAYGLIGYSAGGGAALAVAAEQGEGVTTCIGLSPSRPASVAGITAATLILTCQEDAVVPPAISAGAFEAIPAGTPKAYASMIGAGHFFWWNNQAPGSADDYVIAWLKYWLEEDHSFAATLEQPGSDMTDVRLEAPPLQLDDEGNQGTVESDGGGGGGCAIALISAF